MRMYIINTYKLRDVTDTIINKVVGKNVESSTCNRAYPLIVEFHFKLSCSALLEDFFIFHIVNVKWYTMPF